MDTEHPDSPTEPTEYVRPFAEFLQEQRNGGMHAELSDALNELITGVVDTGRAGTVTLTVSVKPAGRGSRMVMVSDDVRVKKPTPERPEALFFVDRVGNLSRDNPEQQRLPLTTVPRPSALTPVALKEVQ